METDRTPTGADGHRTAERIELRSEKVRRMVASMPAAPMRWGLIIILLILAALVLAVCLIPYPYSHGESILRHIVEG